MQRQTCAWQPSGSSPSLVSLCITRSIALQLLLDLGWTVVVGGWCRRQITPSNADCSYTHQHTAGSNQRQTHLFEWYSCRAFHRGAAAG